jgi:hypothetical protein
LNAPWWAPIADGISKVGTAISNVVEKFVPAKLTALNVPIYQGSANTKKGLVVGSALLATAIGIGAGTYNRKKRYLTKWSPREIRDQIEGIDPDSPESMIDYETAKDIRKIAQFKDNWGHTLGLSNKSEALKKKDIKEMKNQLREAIKQRRKNPQ